MPCAQGGRKASGFDSIALGTDGTGLVMGREQGFGGWVEGGWSMVAARQAVATGQQG